MAKKSACVRNELRKLSSHVAREKRLALKKQAKSENSEERWQAALILQKRPRDENPCRVRARCQRCGRPRGTFRRFGLCRMCLRLAAMNGYVPGLRKASW